MTKGSKQFSGACYDGGDLTTRRRESECGDGCAMFPQANRVILVMELRWCWWCSEKSPVVVKGRGSKRPEVSFTAHLHPADIWFSQTP